MLAFNNVFICFFSRLSVALSVDDGEEINHGSEASNYPSDNMHFPRFSGHKSLTKAEGEDAQPF